MCSGRIFKGSHHQTAPTALRGTCANFRCDSQADYFLLLLNPAISLYGKGRTELLNNSGWRNCWRSSGPHGNVTVPLFPDSKILRSIITLKATAQTPPQISPQHPAFHHRFSLPRRDHAVWGSAAQGHFQTTAKRAAAQRGLRPLQHSEGAGSAERRYAALSQLLPFPQG